MASDSPTCGGIILCGGHSQRMGLPKALLPFGPETMLSRTTRLLAEAIAPMVIVAAAEQEIDQLPPGVELVRDRHPDRGPLEGMAAGMRALFDRCQAVYVTSCDAPFLQPAFVRRLIELRGSHRICVPHVAGHHHLLSAVYRIDVLRQIQDLLAVDSLPVRSLLESTDIREVTASELLDVDPQLLTLRNLNLPEDYLAALTESGFTCPPQILEQLKKPKPGE